MEIIEEKQSGINIFKLNGRLDSNTSQGFEQKLFQAISDGSKNMVVDFKDLQAERAISTEHAGEYILEDIAKATVKSGQEALSGKDGPMKSCIQLGSSIILQRMTGNNILECSKEVLKVIESGSALKRMKS